MPSPRIHKNKDHHEVQLSSFLLPSQQPAEMDTGDGHSSPAEHARLLLALQRGLHVQREVLKDQFVANIIQVRKLGCTGTLQRRGAQHRSCVRYSWPLLSMVPTKNGASPTLKVKRGGQTLSGGLEGQPSGSGHSNQTTFKFSSQGTRPGHITSSLASRMVNRELGTQSRHKLPLPGPSWVRSPTQHVQKH